MLMLRVRARYIQPVRRALSTVVEEVKPPKKSWSASIGKAADSLQRSRDRGASWGEAIQEGVIGYREVRSQLACSSLVQLSPAPDSARHFRFVRFVSRIR